MPIFKLEQTANLKNCLTKLGLVDAFKTSANFSKIFKNVVDPIYISEVLHKVIIDVNEKGTTASAATVPIFRGGGAPPIKFKITIDKPFYAIISGLDAIPYFFSKVTHPRHD
ncbi:Serine protease inhibitor 2.1 [Entamoeba marina]